MIIGWKESIDLPDWGIESILAKADTGALRSAIDVKRMHLLDDGRIEFDIVLSRKAGDLIHTVRSQVEHTSRVRSSNGQMHERYFVKTRVRIGRKVKEIELSLVCRKSMICRMLLGRKALAEDFVVDPEKRYVINPRRRVRIKKPKGPERK